MKKPTKVTTNIIRRESGSRRKAISGRKFPIDIQTQRDCVKELPAGGPDKNSTPMRMVMSAANPIEPAPTKAITDFEALPQKKIRIKKPMNGSEGMRNKRFSISESQPLILLARST